VKFGIWKTITIFIAENRSKAHGSNCDKLSCVFINVSNGSLPNSDFAEILQDVFLIPRAALQNL
jgi:hypothetical protein